jgi:hypothetical protein
MNEKLKSKKFETGVRAKSTNNNFEPQIILCLSFIEESTFENKKLQICVKEDRAY